MDGKYYCYEYWDSDAKCVVTQRLEVGKDLSLELTIMLDESDHDMDLQERYEGVLRDPLFDAKVSSYKADPNNEDAVDPWDMMDWFSGTIWRKPGTMRWRPPYPRRKRRVNGWQTSTRC